MITPRKKLVLLDAHAIIHRAYHGMPDFATRAGIPTGAIYGFASMILKIIDDFKPDYIVACYDLPGKTFRHESYSDYKGSRSETHDALKMQFPITRDICDIFSIPIYDATGFEADDILGTISEQLKNEDIDIVIASGDMDTLQLVDNDRVRVFTLKRGNDTVIYNEAAVVERFGFDPLSIIDYKALRGDASDNIPGIRGIGDKAATLAIVTFGTIEKMYDELEKGEEKFLEIGLTKRMIGLIREGREEAEFSKVLATIRTDAPVDFVFPKKDWISSIQRDAAIELFDKYELRALHNRLDKTLGEIGVRIPEKDIEKSVEIVGDKDVALTSIALWVLDSDETQSDTKKILEYTGLESFSESTEKIMDDLKTDKKSFAVYEHIEKPLYPIVQNMQKNGVLVDQDFFKKLSVDYHAELSSLEKKIFSYAGQEFNIKSPKQLGEILFDTMALPSKGIKKSKTGSYSTNIDTLEKLLGAHDIIPLIIEYRELQKLLSTYIDVIPIMVGDDGRLHAEFLQNGTVTGRFSSRNPNLQNIPTRTDLGRKIREGFIAEKGKVLVSLDYSQIELRILAILSEDQSLIQIFKDGRDIHSAVAAQIGGVDESQVDREMRRKAKVVNFGILYGMGINSLKKEMNVERDEAQHFYNGFFEQFPKATAFLEATKQYARDNGHTETLFGRRRQFRSINAKLPFIRAMAERMALNAPIQGTAADIIKIAMVHVYEQLLKEYHSARLILQIHDEIIYEVDETRAEDFSKKVITIMENVFKDSYIHFDSKVPLVVHTSIGKNWGELK